MKTFAELNNAFATANTISLRLGEVVIDHTYQMREQMNHDVIDNYVDALDALPPINIIEVRGRKILVDGFHRYFAFERAEREELPALLIEGTEQDAMVYAMAANFEHLKSGSKPNGSDQKRAILKLLPMAVEMAGYNSAKIKSSLKDLGIITSNKTFAKWTEEARREVDLKALRLAKQLRTEMSVRSITEKLGIHRDALTRLFSMDEECADSLRKQSAHPASVVDSTPIEEGNLYDEEGCPFDEDELEEVTIVNPADAKSKALSDLEKGLTKDIAASVTPIESKLEQQPKVGHNTHTGTSSVRTLQEFAFAWKHAKEDIASFLDAETDQSEDVINAILEAAEFINNTRI
jgi:hypothetical protein